VGVNVPNASIMVIEQAESFGLAQLHQLRGRVGRGSDASTCLLIFRPPLTESGQRRLETIRETEDGFRIADEDLAMRGAGDVIGTAQSGLPRFRIADIERQAGLMMTAQSDARKLLAEDPDLTSPRGEAARTLLWLLEKEKAIRLISAGLSSQMFLKSSLHMNAVVGTKGQQTCPTEPCLWNIIFFQH